MTSSRLLELAKDLPLEANAALQALLLVNTMSVMTAIINPKIIQTSNSKDPDWHEETRHWEVLHLPL